MSPSGPEPDRVDFVLPDQDQRRLTPKGRSRNQSCYPTLRVKSRTTKQQKKTDSRAVLVYADARCRSAGLLQLVHE